MNVVEDAKKKEKKKFAAGFCFKKYFLVFLIGSIFGAYYEEIMLLIRTYIHTGTFQYVVRRGVIYGPLSPVYGAGCVLITMAFARQKNFKWYHYLFYGALACGAVEYLISFLQETFIGTVSWDYSDLFLNINGRTTFIYMLFWGFLTLLWCGFIYPKLSYWIENIPYRFGNILFWILLVLVSLDCLISWTALFRSFLRRQNIPPATFVGEFYDSYYTDEFLNRHFTNMIITR